MKIAIIGRTEMLYDTAVAIKEYGFDIACILTAKEASEYKRTAADFEALALLWDIPFAQGGKIIRHLDFLKQYQADIAVSINYVGVIPQHIIDLFPLGILNAHGGDLPRYRGNACQAWAILNGEEKIGLCIHKMIGGELDSGDIITRDYLKIKHNTNITQVWEWMARQTPICSTLLGATIYCLGGGIRCDCGCVATLGRSSSDGRPLQSLSRWGHGQLCLTPIFRIFGVRPTDYIPS